MTLIEQNEYGAIIYGISKPFEKLIDEINKSELTSYWFFEIDNFYFSKNSYKIILNENDERIIKESIDCYNKLKTLSFKKNITILRCFESKF